MVDFEKLEAVIRRDPGGRGLASYRDADGRPLLPDELRRAARSLAAHGRRALVVTGFCVVTPEGVTAETDGPPGAIYLAGMLRACGIESSIAADRYAAPSVRAGLKAAGLPARLPDELLIEFPQRANDAPSRDEVRAWRRKFATGGESFSHLIAVEHVGPGHTAESIAEQAVSRPESDMSAEFERLVPVAERDACRNMRGVSIDEHTAPLHVLFERPQHVADSESPAATTIGVVDGGNEIGCGSIPWDVLRRAVAQGPAALTACRVATDHTIVAGVSNWGAYALGAAVASLRGARAAVEAWTAERQAEIIRATVERGGAVDGVTKRREPTVDGLPSDQESAMFDEIRRIVLAG